VVGTTPTQYLLYLDHVPPFSEVHLFWNGYWSDVALLVALLAIALTATGVVALFVERRTFAAATFVGALAYGGFVFIDIRGGSGTLLTFMYLTPILSTLAAYGTQFVARRLAREVPTRHARHSIGRRLTIGTGTVCSVAVLILVFQAGASAEDEAFFVHQPGMLPRVNMKLAEIASRIPKGATVLMYSSNSATAGATLLKTQALVAAAGYLPDREITIDGSYFTGTYGPADAKQIDGAYAYKYQYVLHYNDPSIRDRPVPSIFHVVWTFPQDHLVLYERNNK
jgi:hypothetical protein